MSGAKLTKSATKSERQRMAEAELVRLQHTCCWCGCLTKQRSATFEADCEREECKRENGRVRSE